MLLSQVFPPTRIKLSLESGDKAKLFEELVDILDGDGGSGFPRDAILDAIWEREGVMSTGIARGIALPHGKAEGLIGLSGVLGVSHSGIEYAALDGQPVRVVFLLVSAPKDSELHLAALKRLGVILDDPEFYAELVKAESPMRANAIIRNFESKLADLGHSRA